MRVLELRIDTLAGLRTAIHLREQDLDGALRVVHGPNGSGKSSLVRALRSLLWEQQAGVPEPVDAWARLRLRDEEWTVLRRDGRTHWEHAGQPAARPKLPEFAQAAHLLVSLEDLGPELEQGRDIVAHLRSELSGGYDLDAVREALHQTYPQKVGHSPASTLEKAEAALRVAEAEQEQALAGEAELPALKTQLDAALRAAGDVRRLDAALDRQRARASLEQAQAALDDFPSGLDALNADDCERLKELTARRNDAERDCSRAVEAERCAQEAITRSGLREVVTPAAFEEWSTRREQLLQGEARLRELRGQLEKARASCVTATQSLSAVSAGELAAERALRCDAAALGRLEQLVRESLKLEAALSGIESELARLGPDSRIALPADGAAATLESWLGASAEVASGKDGQQTLLLWAGVVQFAGWIVAGFLVQPWLLLGAIPAAVVIWLAWPAGRVRASATGSSRAGLQAQFEDLGENPPERWTPAAVRARLAALRQQEREARAAEEQRQRRRQLAAELASAREAEGALQQRRATLQADFGAPAELGDTGLLAWVQRREALLQARDEAAAAEAALFETEKLVAQELQALCRALDGLVSQTPRDAATAGAVIADLRARSESLQRARSEEQSAVRMQREAAAERERQEQALLSFRKRTGLSPDEEGAGELQRRLDALPAWRAADGAVKVAQGELAAHGNDSELDGLEPEQLLRRREEQQGLAEAEQECRARIAAINQRSQQARESAVLGEARLKRDQALQTLRGVHERTRTGVLADLLLDEVRQAHEQTSEPRLLEAARSHFARFTHGRYKLEALRDAESGLSLVARDTHDNAPARPLAELSDGTRAQLLLAARLAYLAEIEGDEKLPLVLDDALATSDPARVAAIGAALLDEARAGRQILVLTTDAANVNLLAADANGATGDVQATDLAELRKLQMPVARRERLALPALAEVPAPDGHTPEAWARLLGVPPPDARHPVGDLHLWWLLQHEPARTHALLSLRITTVGQLQQFAASGSPLVSEQDVAALQPWSTLAGAVFEAWQVGRGKPLDRAVLEAAGVTPTYIERLTELAGELHGDAKAWLQIVAAREDERTRRYRVDTTLVENRAYFAEHGYLDERERLDVERAWQHVLDVLATQQESALAPDALPALRQRFEQLWAACGD